MNIIRLYRDHARRVVGPDLGINGLQRLSEDDISRQKVKPGPGTENHTYP